MQDPTVEAVVLGAVQAATEFLPISSSGHLALAQLLFGHEANVALSVLLHAGTLLATFIVLRTQVAAALGDATRAITKPSRLLSTHGGRDAAFVLIASVPTAAIGLGLRKAVANWSSSPTVIGACFLISALLVVSTRFAPKGEALHPSAAGALLVGIAQGVAVLPGVSRSAATIWALLWIGVRTDRAFELSFLLSLPAVLGAVLLEGRHGLTGSDPPLALLAGTFVALAAGIVALVALKRVMQKGKLAWFAVYLVPLAIATLAWGHARPFEP